MRYMLMMHAPRGTGDYAVNSWKPEELKAHIGFMHQLNRDLTERGELVGAEGLAPPGQARVVKCRPERPACSHGRTVRRDEGIPRRLLDRGCGQ